jgi:hypothetical protein
VEVELDRRDVGIDARVGEEQRPQARITPGQGAPLDRLARVCARAAAVVVAERGQDEHGEPAVQAGEHRERAAPAPDREQRGGADRCRPVQQIVAAVEDADREAAPPLEEPQHERRRRHRADAGLPRPDGDAHDDECQPGVDPRHEQDAAGHQQGAGREHAPRAQAIGQRSGERHHRDHRDHACRHREREIGARPAEVGEHRFHEHGDGDRERGVGGDREHADRERRPGAPGFAEGACAVGCHGVP